MQIVLRGTNSDDLLMVTLARLIFDLVLPTEDAGDHALTCVEKDVRLVRHLFEKAIGNFYAAELLTSGWKVHPGKHLNWQVEDATPGIADILPGMVTDIILEHAVHGRRIIIDTKFTAVFGSSPHRFAVLKSGYIYQLYAYLRSQERTDDPLSLMASGMFLHPTVDVDLDETARIQGHEIRFVTVNLTAPTAEIVQRLRTIYPFHSSFNEGLSHTTIRLHPPRDLRHVPDRIVDVGLAHRDRVHFAAMRAVHVERHGPGVAEAFHVGQDAGVGLLPGLRTGKEE